MQSLKTNSPQIKIKVCGIRHAKEAEALDGMGVEYLGFNFHPKSARYLSPEAAKPIIQGLGNAIPVGVFVDLQVSEVLKIILEAGLKMVQLHGQEDASYISKMPVPVIKAIPHSFLARIAGPVLGIDKAAPLPTPLKYFLVDTQTSPKAKSEFGGSGKTFAWELLGQNPLPLPYFLAGGLGVENLEKALEVCKNFLPFAFDLNSKVEIAPGQKDLSKVQSCINLVQEFNNRR